MIRGILKPMPDYRVHFIAGVEITSAGREFIVDDEEVDEAFERYEKRSPDEKRAMVAARLNGQQHSDEAGVYRPCKQGVEHVRNPDGRVVQTVPYRIYDEHERPLLLSQAAYELIFRPQFARLLNCEPVGGVPAAGELLERIAASEREHQELRARVEQGEKSSSQKIAELVDELERRKDELERSKEGNRAGMAELERLRARNAELEAAAAKPASKPAR